MTDKKIPNYEKLAIKTEPSLNEWFHKIKWRLHDEKTGRLLHAAMGLSTESGEFMDALKRHVYYGEPLDYANLVEEIGDIFWYCALAADVIGTDFETIMAHNIAKLRTRYGEKFTEDRAINRDIENEREAGFNPKV